MHYLYLITRDDGEQYVGVTQYLSRRMKEHFAGNGSKSLKGRSFTHDIIQEGNEEEIFRSEQEYIKQFKPGLNKAAGGWGGNTGGQKGEDSHFAKITEADVLKIRELIATTTVTHEGLATAYGISRATIGDICKGKSWAHVGGPLTERSTRPNSIPLEIKKEIRQLYLSGIKVADISRKLQIPYHSAFKYSKEDII